MYIYIYIYIHIGTQWGSLIQSWVLKLSTTAENKAKLHTAFAAYVKPTLRWMAKNVAPVVTLQDMNFVQVNFNP
jgi:hypothetical protein